jgi:hypothetical protein
MRLTKASSGWPTHTGRWTGPRKGIALAALVAASLIGGPGTAGAGTPAVTDLLPDLDQSAPSEVATQSFGNKWHLIFGSEIYNHGAGPMQLRGERPDTAVETMAVTQVVHRSDNSTRDEALAKTLKFVPFNHNHWHILDLERYELRSLADPSKVAADHKTGFCLADLSPDNCGQNDPTRAGPANPVNEGLRVSTSPGNGFDYYLPVLEGQYVEIDPTTTPAGRYDLTHRSNADRVLLEASYDNNAASVELRLDWAGDGTPSVVVLNSCPASATCGIPYAPPAPPNPDSQPEPTPPQEPAPEPAPFAPAMTVKQTTFGPKYLMTRKDAARLVREALGRVHKTSALRVKVSCERRGAARFACDGTWWAGKRAWSGHVGVWYRPVGGKLVWVYNVSARSGHRRVHARRAQGGARIAWASLSPTLVCHGSRPAKAV